MCSELLVVLLTLLYERLVELYGVVYSQTELTGSKFVDESPLVFDRILPSVPPLNRVLVHLRCRKLLSGKKTEYPGPFSIVGAYLKGTHYLSNTVAVMFGVS